MELLIGLVQAVLLIVAAAIALWLVLRRVVTHIVIDRLQLIEFDVVMRELPPVNPDTGVDPIETVAKALTDGTERIDDPRFGGRAACRATAEGVNARMVEGAAVEVRSDNFPMSISVVPGAPGCSLSGLTAVFSMISNRTTLAVGLLPLSNAIVILQGIDSSTTFSTAPLSGSDDTVVRMFSRVSIDAIYPATNFARGSFELMLRNFSDMSDRTVLFVTNGRFGLRRQ